MEENSEVSDLDLSINPSFEEHKNFMIALEQRSINMSKMHEESDLDSVVDEYIYISHLFNDPPIFVGDPKSLDYEIRVIESTTSKVYLPTYSTVFKDSDYEIERDKVTLNDFYLATYPSRDVEDMEEITQTHALLRGV